MATIRLIDVSKSYPVGKKKLFRKQRHAIGVANVDLTIKQGEFVFIIGGSGAGKSTLVDLITGAIKPDDGRVLVDNHTYTGLYKQRNNLVFGRVWQEQMTLVRKMTVEENLMMVARIGRKKGESAKEMDERISKVLGLVGMSGVRKRYPVELSIGECRRVELARALINSPSVLILDEITANLDDDNIWDIFHLLTEVNRRGTTVIMATHASRYVNIMRKRVVTLVDGRVFSDVTKGKYGDVV